MERLADKSTQAQHNKLQFLKWHLLNLKRILHSECRYLTDKAIDINGFFFLIDFNKNVPITKVALTIMNVRSLKRKSETPVDVPEMPLLESDVWNDSSILKTLWNTLKYNDANVWFTFPYTNEWKLVLHGKTHNGKLKIIESRNPIFIRSVTKEGAKLMRILPRKQN